VTKSRHVSHKNSGFTIIEIFVIVAIVFVLAAVVFPRYVDFENQTRLAAIKENMRIVQMAVQAYATNNKGEYPIQPEDPGFRSYFPGGNCDRQNPKGGNYPENPFTHKAEAPATGNITDVKQSRHLQPADLGGSRQAGKIFYNVIIPPGKNKAIGYAIEAADQNGMPVMDNAPNTSYILSNI
jgi:type II secretory pathway pseudopilin PulG